MGILNDKAGFWDKLAKTYDNISENDKELTQTLVSLIEKYVNSNTTVLELATGTGIVALKLAPNCKYIEATDFSSKMIEIAKQKENPENLNFAIADVTNLKYNEKSFDVVLISHALHAINKTQLALDNIKKVLKDDGILIAPTFARRHFYTGIFTSILMKILGFHTWRHSSLLNLFENNGWNVLSSDYISHKSSTVFIVAKKEVTA